MKQSHTSPNSTWTQLLKLSTVGQEGPVCHRRQRHEGISPHLTTEELAKARNYWISLSQRDHFCLEIESLKNDSITPESSSLFVLHPFMDSSGLVRVGGRVQDLVRFKASYHSSWETSDHETHNLVGTHAINCYMLGLLSSWHLCVVIIISLVVVKPFHPSLASASSAAELRSSRRVNSWDNFLLNAALQAPYLITGPFYIKYGSVRKPTIIKAYVCIFLSQGSSFGVCCRSDHRRVYRYSPTFHCPSITDSTLLEAMVKGIYTSLL